MMDYEYSNLPLGLGMAVMAGENAKTGYDGLSETEKEHLILQCKDAKNKKEAEKILSSVSPAEELRDLFRGPSIG